MRRLRFVPGRSLVEVTCRTVQGRLLMRPDPVVSDLIRGVLARSARLYGVQVHFFWFLSNHYHLLLTVDSAHQLADFMRYLNSNLAREIGRAVQWRDRFWGRRYQAVLVDSDDAVVQVERLTYLLSQGTKENLVESPREWPGASGLESLLEGLEVSGHWFDRTLAYRARHARVPLQPDEIASIERLQLTPLPCWKDLGEQARRDKVQEIVEAIEAAAARRRAKYRRPALGRDRLLRRSPHLCPGPLTRSPVPLIHALRVEVHRACRRAYRSYFEAFHLASTALRRGARDALFPPGSFPPSLPFVAALAS